MFHKWWPLPGYVTNPLCDKKSFLHSVNHFFVLCAPFSLFKVDFCFFVWQHIEESPYTCADPHYHCAEYLIGINQCVFWNWFVLLIIIYLVSINNICLKVDVLRQWYVQWAINLHPSDYGSTIILAQNVEIFKHVNITL